MKFTKDVIVSRTYEISTEEFVKSHLREIRFFRDGDKVEYDLFIQCGVNPHLITNVLSLKSIDFDLNDFDRYARTDEEKEKHKMACEKLVVLIDKMQEEKA